ncbi:hypothetical protein [Bradyrhizobium sp. AUGA SZCCT0283]|uniref:hypothetical protein n=1 Tax=Bradyrhizobium sp. AUGA SZCCT0283 TaxID=2807671 RepID=UPI001BA783D1|nr:hypothetical protein [Bradyrhizobium sp. AUGA SZCCT0283]MBR1276309.1 hypothetical protein [Bradyrhizobium sp. AUGA SZCCT0283]
MKQPSLGRAALAVSVFTCATMLSFGWSEPKGISLSIERAQAQMSDPYTPGVTRRQARRAAAGAAAVGAGAVAAGATATYYGGGGPYAYYGGDAGGGPYGYYGGPGAWSQDYAARNGIICQPGTMVRLEDGLMHRCQ